MLSDVFPSFYTKLDTISTKPLQKYVQRVYFPVQKKIHESDLG